MKIIERYVFGAFLTSFTLAFLVLTFVLTVGLMIQIVSYVLEGVPMSLVGEFAFVSFPETLQWTMPLALLVASVLVFSRMSADSEIAAFRACGVNLLVVMKWPIAFALVCTALGVYVNNEIVPRGHEIRRSLKNKVTVGTGLEVLEPGKVISAFPKMKIYFGAKDGNWLKDLMVMDYSNEKVDRMITASKALVTSEGRDLVLDLHNMTVDPLDAEHPTMARANRFQYTVKNAFRDTKYRKRDKDLRFFEAAERLRELDGHIAVASGDSKAKGTERNLLKTNLSALRVEVMKRLVFAFASICFVLVGVPLGIRSQRRESSIGMAISLAVSLGYYLVVILALSLEKHFSIHPELLIWLPVAACAVLAAKLIPRNM